MNNMYIKIAIIVTTMCVIVLGVILFLTYVFRFDTPIVVAVRSALRLPAIIVDGKWISITEIDQNTSSIKRFYESQDFASMGVRIDFDTKDGKKRLLLEERKMINKLIENIAIEELAEDWNITVSDEAVQSAMDRPMEEMGTRENVVSRLDKLYGWSLDDFAQKVVRVQILQEKVTKKFEKDNTATNEMHLRIQEAKKELNDGRVFADVAKKYSEGSTAQEGGVVGWFADGQVQDEIGQKVFSMEKGESSDIIETSLGLHIVHVNEISEADGVKMVYISQIIIKKQTFVDFLYERMRNMKVNIFVPEFVWNSNTGQVDFASDEMQQIEQKIQKEAMDELIKEYENEEGTNN